MLLKRIAVAIEQKKDSLFSYPRDKQEKYIKQLGKPKDEIERGYFQYQCQMKLYGWWLYGVLNIAALPMAIMYYVKYKHAHTKKQKRENCVFINNGIPENIVPNSLREEFPNIQVIDKEFHSMTQEDCQFLKRIFKRYPLSWMFWLKIIHKLSRYSSVIEQFSPSTILCCDEFSFTSSVMTKYCRDRDIELINVMHGEKLYYIRDSFVCYDRYYVWDKHYANLLKELGAESSQFRIEVPNSLKISVQEEIEKEYDYTYYLAAEDSKTLSRIASCLHKLKDKGYKVAVRPHPRYTNLGEVVDLLDDIDIEDVREISIDRSLLRTKNAISLYSTTLNQAFHNGTGVVIDDYSNPTKYRKLKDLEYIMLSKRHQLLKSIMKENV